MRSRRRVGTAASDASGEEGDTLTSNGSFTDEDGNETVEITKVSGAGDVTDNGDGTWSWSYATTDNGSGTVVVQADDGEHAAKTDSFDWSATNVDPTATINGAPASSPEGTLISLTSTVSDPGSADTHTYAWSVEKNGNPYASGTSASFSFTPDDNGSYVVSLTIEDDDGGSGSDTETIGVTNVDPTATINGAPASSPEGTLISLTSTVSDPGSADTHTYAWSVEKNGNPYASGTSASFSFTPNDNGSYVVSLTIEDDDGGSGSDTETIGVTNVDPTATINGAPASSPEGTLISLTSTVSDPGSADTHTYAWSVEKNGNPYASGTSASFSFTPDDNGSYVVSLTIEDDDGGSGSDTKTIAGTNVAPTIGALSLSGNTGTACLSGNTVNLQFSFSDPAGSNDTYTGSINWGDTNTTSFGSSFNVNASHTYSPGTYTIKVNVHDEDGGVAAEKQGNVSHLYNTGTGILQPINMTGSRSAFKLGSTVPVKIKITDCNGNPAGTLSPQVSLIKLDGSPDGVAVEDFYSTVPDQGTTMRFTGSPDYQYIYNLGTKGQTQGDFKVTITDPMIAPVSATFSLKK